VQWDVPQAAKDLVNAIVEPKLLEDEGERLGLVKKAMNDKEVGQQKRQTVMRLLEKEEVSDKINPKEEDERAYYQNHLQNYIQPEQRTVREIFVKEDSAKVASLRARALKGENFKKLALKYNEKESTKVDTGRLGPFEQKRFGLIGNAAFQLPKIGDVSDVIANGKNYSVVQLMDIVPSRTKSFDEARAQASREYRMAKTDEAQKALEAMLLEKYRLKIQDDKLSRAYPMMEPPAAAKPDTTKKG
jgi:parvulin-like peptidyl-prolyl isomerase